MLFLLLCIFFPKDITQGELLFRAYLFSLGACGEAVNRKNCTNVAHLSLYVPPKQCFFNHSDEPQEDK